MESREQTYQMLAMDELLSVNGGGTSQNTVMMSGNGNQTVILPEAGNDFGYDDNVGYGPGGYSPEPDPTPEPEPEPTLEPEPSYDWDGTDYDDGDEEKVDTNPDAEPKPEPDPNPTPTPKPNPDTSDQTDSDTGIGSSPNSKSGEDSIKTESGEGEVLTDGKADKKTGKLPTASIQMPSNEDRGRDILSSRMASPIDQNLTGYIPNFDERYEKTKSLLPMQKTKDGKVKYPVACEYFAVVSAFVNKGYKYRNNLTKSDVEKIANDAVNDGIAYSDVIKEVFGIEVSVNTIPKNIKINEFKTLVKDSPAVVYFTQNDYWKNGEKTAQHGIGFANGGFFEAWCGYHGDTWEKVRAGKSLKNDATFETNKGGYYFEIKN